MWVTRLDVRGLRRLAEVSLRPGPGFNLITGDNGAGKTSLLEALHLMAYGRSFRGRVRDGLVRTGVDAVEVFVEWRQRAGVVPHNKASANGIGAPVQGWTSRRAGLRHTGHTWEGRLDGDRVAQLSQLCTALAVVCFEPDSHALITNGGEPRRRYVDWGLFHVEHGFLPLWRRYGRALKQRNAALKACERPGDLDVWDSELAEAGEPLTHRRQQYLAQLQPHLARLAVELAPALGETTLIFQPGWKRELALADALRLTRARDLHLGFTSVGPHRADWRLQHAALPNGELLSRGQAKLVALASLLAQASHYQDVRGEWPIIVLDDLAAELDRKHQHRVLERLLQSGAQVFATSADAPAAWAEIVATTTMFHVEHGKVVGLVER